MGICSQGTRLKGVDENLLRGNISGKGDSGYTHLKGFLLKTGQDGQTSSGG